MREKPERYDYRAFLYVLVACLIETAGFFYALFFGVSFLWGLETKDFYGLSGCLQHPILYFLRAFFERPFFVGIIF